MANIPLSKLAIAASKLTSAGEYAFKAFYDEGENQQISLERMRENFAKAAEMLGYECVEKGTGE